MYYLLNSNLNYQSILIMFSINQFTLQSSEFDHQDRLKQMSTSKGSNTANRQLFHKCKQLIQEQMQQINFLTKQNQQLSQQLDIREQQSIELSKQVERMNKQLAEVKNLNQMLHKQVNKYNRLVEDASCGLKEKKDLIKLTENKAEVLESNLRKSEQQNLAYRTKCELLQQTIQLMANQNSQMKSVIQSKNQQIARQIQQLRRVNMILKRRNNIQQLDQSIVMNERLSNMSQLSKLNLSCQPFITVNEGPFTNVQFRRQPQKNRERSALSRAFRANHSTQLKRERIISENQGNLMNSFSIIDRKQSTSPVSRIRKNVSKQAHQAVQKYEHLRQQKSVLMRKPFTPLSNQSPNNKSEFNPEIQSQLSSIKKQILQQYNKIQAKKQMMNHERISHTLQQIENKLKKMVNITAFNDSQSQIQ